MDRSVVRSRGCKIVRSSARGIGDVADPESTGQRSRDKGNSVEMEGTDCKGGDEGDRTRTLRRGNGKGVVMEAGGGTGSAMIGDCGMTSVSLSGTHAERFPKVISHGQFLLTWKAVVSQGLDEEEL